MAHGGKRPGAGRKPGIASVLAEKTKAYIAEKIEREIGPLTDKLFEKAKKGDVFAFRELMDRGFGRPQQAIDHTTDGKELPVPILGGLSTKTDVPTHDSTDED